MKWNECFRIENWKCHFDVNDKYRFRSYFWKLMFQNRRYLLFKFSESSLYQSMHRTCYNLIIYRYYEKLPWLTCKKEEREWEGKGLLLGFFFEYIYSIEVEFNDILNFSDVFNIFLLSKNICELSPQRLIAIRWRWREHRIAKNKKIRTNERIHRNLLTNIMRKVDMKNRRM